MNPKRITKLRRTFIAVATGSFLLVILIMGFIAGLSNYLALAGEANRTLDAIVDAGGEVPAQENFKDGSFFEESVHGMRFFTVAFDKEGNVMDVNLSHVASVDAASAIDAAADAADPNTIMGLSRAGHYIYKEYPTKEGSLAVFLDCAVPMANATAATINTMLAAAVALVITFLLVLVLSGRAIKPEVENARRQQQFMTNAGHELKTPISVIRANTEITEMLSGETEWTQSTMRQVDRLDELVRDLMTIVRDEERAGDEVELLEVDASSVIANAVDSFQSVAQQRGVRLESSIAEGALVKGQESSIEQLACLLVDNAIKYCDENGTIRVKLTPALVGRGFTFSVSNDFAEGADVDYRRFFDRFYREDESHENQQGYGIGLSVAQSICERYHGSIKASWKAGVITFTCAVKDA